MKISEKKARIAVTLFGFILLALYFGAELATKYLLGGIAAGVLAIVIIMIWNKITLK
jgi:hypothetical protein